MTRFATRLSIFILGTVAISGCCLVDENLCDCETAFNLEYELRLITNMNTEISGSLGSAEDAHIAQAIRDYLDGVFTDRAHDVDLGFYDVVRDEYGKDSLRLRHETHIMGASRADYTFFMPIRDYMHLAVANIDGNGQVSLENGDLCHSARLAQTVRDTVGTHATGLFSARLAMGTGTGDSRSFHADLYIANCAAALVIDTLGSHVRDIRVFASGFATAFNVCDSSFLYSYTPEMRADRLPLGKAGSCCFAIVSFPSQEPVQTRTVTETEEPFSSERSETALWRYSVYTTMADGTITETLLGIHTPLRAGQLKILRAKALENGAVQPDDPTVGISVALDWEPGAHHEIEL